MANEGVPANLGEIIANWKIPEYNKHDRSRLWYIIAITVGLFFLIYSAFTLNFLFAVITILGALIIVLHENKHPALIDVLISEEGIVVGRKFYDFDEINNFAVVYKPLYGEKNLYFEFKSPIRQRLSIPLEDENPLPIRRFLLKYLEEDLERENIPLSEQLGKWLKL